LTSEHPIYVKQLFLISSVVFIVLFFLIFGAVKSGALESFNEANDASPAIRLYSSNQQKVGDIFSKYGVYGGVLFGILSLVLMKIIGLFLGKLKDKLLVKQLLALAPFALILIVFGHICIFEPRSSLIANAIIYFISFPLFYTSLILTLAIGIWAAFPLIKPLIGKGSSHGK